MKLYHLSCTWEEYEDQDEVYIGTYSSEKARENAMAGFILFCGMSDSYPFSNVKGYWDDIEDCFLYWESELDEGLV